MKLIIELSENDYKALKEEGVQNHIALADTIIARSVPYEETQGEYKCVTCKYRSCEITEKPCRNCSRSWVDLYEEADMKGGAV